VPPEFGVELHAARSTVHAASAKWRTKAPGDGIRGRMQTRGREVSVDDARNGVPLQRIADRPKDLVA
jgi:hypothetical protein